MNKSICLLLVLMGSVSAFAAKERVVKLQNTVRVGYDDNVYNSAIDEKGTGFITDIVNVSGKFVFSSRSDMLLYWQPEFRYRFNADPDFVSYQDFYARLNHALSQRAFLTLSDRFAYREQDGQADGLSVKDQNYIENDLLGSLEYTINTLSYLKLGAGYGFRTWDDDEYGKYNEVTLEGGNNFEQITGNASYVRQLKQNMTQGILGAQYTDLTYDGSRGGYEAIAAYLGVDQNFTSTLSAFARIGGTFSDVTSGTNSVKSDTTSPYFDLGVGFNPTARTALNASATYSISRAENSLYNAQDRLNIGLTFSHDITAKISVVTGLSYIRSYYNSDYATSLNDSILGNYRDELARFTIRTSYQINRNNFIDLGYAYTDRFTSYEGNADYNKNVVDLSWRLRL